MSWDDEMWSTATNFGSSDSSYDTPRTPDSAPVNALQSLSPVSDSQNGNSWTNLFQEALKTGIQYTIAKDAAKTQVGLQQRQQAAPIVVQQQAQNNSLITLAIIGAVVFVAVKAVD